MRFTFPKTEVTVHLSSKAAEYIQQQAITEDRSPDNIVESAIIWYQLLMETQGAREAIISMRPPMPSKIESEPCL